MITEKGALWGSENAGNIKETLGQQMMDYIHSLREEGAAGETKDRYAARVYAKAQSGQKLTPDEMSFLARTNPALYSKVLRAQSMRRALENKLKACKSKQEAEEAFALAVRSISKNDPDRDLIIKTLTQAYKDFKESEEYKQLPEKKDEDNENIMQGIQYQINTEGYQETYQRSEHAASFAING